MKAFVAIALLGGCSADPSSAPHADGGARASSATCEAPGGTANELVEAVSAAGACLPRVVPVGQGFRSSCRIFEVTSTDTCECTGARLPVPKDTCTAIEHALVQSGAPARGCICELAQATGQSMTDCQTEPTPASTSRGWCILMRGCAPSEALLADCGPHEPGKLRFIGSDVPAAGAKTFIACGQELLEASCAASQ